MRNYEELLIKYLVAFDDSFPTYLAPENEEEQMDIIEECLKTKTPYDPYANGEIDPDANY